MNISDKILDLRKKKGLSQEELGNLLNVSRQTVSKWELGESTPDFDKIVPLCEIFEISTEELLRDKEKEEEVKEVKKEKLLKPILISTSIFLYFFAIVVLIVMEETFNMDDGIVVGTFLTIIGIATAMITFAGIALKGPKKEREVIKKEKNPLLESILGILYILATIVYLFVSFSTGAWHITWLIWLVSAMFARIIRLIFNLIGDDKNE